MFTNFKLKANGLSWQVYPEAMHQMLQDPNSDRVTRVTQAFLQMKKIDVSSLEQAYKDN